MRHHPNYCCALTISLKNVIYGLSFKIMVPTQRMGRGITIGVSSNGDEGNHEQQCGSV